ncbi:hypothetical protein LXL04_023767 [Taraxacum kok-saghyz]
MRNTVKSAVMLDEDDDFVNSRMSNYVHYILKINVNEVLICMLKQAYAAIIELGYEKIQKEKKQMELSLEVGLKKFPNSAILHEWMLKKNELFYEPHDDEVANETSETETESDN